MINFFRKIRKQLADDNKPLKYMRYAIGEIALVVIGILIALSINNWNEQSKKDLEEKAILSGLIQNIGIDIVKLRELKKRDSLFLIANKVLLSAFINDSIRKDKSLLKLSIIKGTFTGSFTPTQTVFNEMRFSGKLNYISTDSIRNKIQKYYDNITETLNTQVTNEKVIHELGISTMDYLDFNSTLQLTLPEYAKMELDEFDNSFFYEPLESAKVKEFANLISFKQSLMLSIYWAYNRSLQDGIILKQNLIEYLETK